MLKRSWAKNLLPSGLRGRDLVVWYLLALLVLLMDQLTKGWIVSEFYLGQREVITSFFNLVHVRNYGAAFSFLSDAGGWQRWFFAILSTLVSVVIVIWIANNASISNVLIIAPVQQLN